MELAQETSTGREFYIQHKPVIRQSSKSTKIRVVYDPSANENAHVTSLNDCLYPGSALPNKLWDVLTRSKLYPVALCGEI